ncbi:spore germination protein [Bacillus pseudomycoides]|nr:spore germination protein [Bacillus pseudomycoides]PDY02537.1 spore germination protein [Bacillus pseudomycoides]PEK81053.1 spore germination protein [Bacillus pseudomycoides]PEN04936.1 spore germination protein [Bacillus pseudomycoides]PGB88611.1 spore germination protein [Bacillus pseudomycoides]PHE57659.1 spore germination protein [Bacillus pseudomycoides]
MSCTIPEFIHTMKESTDFVSYNITKNGKLCLFYYKSVVEELIIKRFILTPIKKQLEQIQNIADLTNIVFIEDIIISPSIDDIREKLLGGYVLIELQNTSNAAQYALIQAESTVLGKRLYNDTENEYSVIGPKVGFVESIDINIHLLRRGIITEQLIFKEIIVGSLSKTHVTIAYIKGLTNEQHINTATQRLQDIDFDVPFDATMIEQFLSDNSNSPFPVLLPTERVDRAVFALITGQVLILTDGSPYALAGPTTLLDFFVSPEDYYLPWIIGSFFRIIRFFGALFSLFSSAIYTAVLTFHYQMIPSDLLGPIIFSRANVPFPPVLEALFLEITIELLREAGARLPTKVGQTIGIVGGIVIGQASVQAALTSTILLIAVALSALASFTTPTVKMSSTIRLLRFPLIVLAGAFGGLGLIVGFVMILTHLIQLKSLGSPYLVPLYPFRGLAASEGFIRFPFSHTAQRPSFLRSKSNWRYNPSKAKTKRDGEKT